MSLERNLIGVIGTKENSWHAANACRLDSAFSWSNFPFGKRVGVRFSCTLVNC